ncbi:MAG: hypothetical protein JRH20_01885 [Deltaproteobacteria bacterium]|nr:hypothetical protein [Deltaproteobacteria bacterium]
MNEHRGGKSWIELWALFALVTAAVQLSDGVAQALLLKRVGVDALPTVFAAKAVLSLIFTFAYIPLAATLGTQRTLTVILALNALVLATLAATVSLDHALGYGMLYAFIEAGHLLFRIHWGVVILALIQRDRAMREVPLVYSGARVGAALGGAGLTFAPRLGAPQLLPLAALLHASALLVWVARGRRHHFRQSGEPTQGHLSGPLSAFNALTRSSLLAAIAMGSAALAVVRHGLRYLYSGVFATTFAETQLASFLGLYAVSAALMGALLQALLAPHLLVGNGMATVNLLYGALLPAAALSFRVGWPMAAAIFARLVETDLKTILRTPVANLLYGGLPSAQRPAARAFVLGILLPAATLLASLALGSAPQHTTLWVGAVGLLYVLLSGLQNRAYRCATATPAAGPDEALSPEADA